MAAAEGSAEAFLAAHGLAAAADTFRTEGFDTAQQLVEARLTDADLRELGLAQMMPRKRLLNALSDEAARPSRYSYRSKDMQSWHSQTLAGRHDGLSAAAGLLVREPSGDGGEDKACRARLSASDILTNVTQPPNPER